MAEDSRLSSVIDDDGRIFGLINVIDALVLIGAVAILLLGVVLWAPAGGDTGTETRYVTIEIESQPAYLAEQIREGDRMTPAGTSGAVTITDVYQYMNSDGDITTIARAEVDGTALNSVANETDAIRFGGNPIRYGSEFELSMTNYVVTGTIVEIDREGSTLQTATESFVVQLDLDRRTANRIDTGDGFQLGDSELVMFDTVTVYPRPGNDQLDRRAIVGVNAEVLADGPTPLLGEQPVRPGSELTVRTQSYDLTGDVIRVGSLEEPGTPEARIATVELSGISPERADALSVGASEETRDLTTATIVNKTSRPAQQRVVVDGEVRTSADPLNRDVTLAVELNVRLLDDGSIRFRGEQLEIGQEIAFDFGRVTVNGRLTDLE
jgi:hypothetical protein